MVYQVVRLYSHTDKQQLLKVGSRQMDTLQQAKNWAEYLNNEEPHENPWYPIAIPEQTL